GERGVDVGRFYQRERTVARVARAHGTQRDEVAAAGAAQPAHVARIAAVLGRVRLQPARGVVDVHQRQRILPARRVAEVDGRDDRATGGEARADVGHVQTVAARPLAAVHVQDGRERAAATRAVDAGEPGLVGVPAVLDVEGLDLVV